MMPDIADLRRALWCLEEAARIMHGAEGRELVNLLIGMAVQAMGEVVEAEGCPEPDSAGTGSLR